MALHGLTWPYMVGEVWWYHRVPRTAPGPLEHRTGTRPKVHLAHFGRFGHFWPFATGRQEATKINHFEVKIS